MTRPSIPAAALEELLGERQINAPWTWETHQLSEGYSSIVYDKFGHRIADHLTEDRAQLIALAPDLAAEVLALRARVGELEDGLRAIERFETNQSTMTVTPEHAGCIDIASLLLSKPGAPR